MLNHRPLHAAIVLVGVTAGSLACNARDDGAQPAAAPATAATNAQGRDGACAPIDSRDPNAAGQQPAFPGQTRACGMTSAVAFDVTVVAKGLEHPWAVEPLPDGNFLVTERPGRLRVVSAAGQIGEPLAGLPQVDARGQGGLLDVALDPDFEGNRTIYWSYAERRQGGNGTSVARGVLGTDRRRLENVEVIFRAMPTYDGRLHFGSRLVFGPDGTLYVTLGERSDTEMRQHAQAFDSHLGKIVRINRDGSAPPDNRFVGRPGALPEIWTLGHRNIQAAAFDAQGQLWALEHGPRGGDELNRIQRGENYGWPNVTYGEEYSGAAIRGAVTASADFEQPIYYWDPVIAPSGAQFYTGDAFPEWRNHLFVGGLVAQSLVRLRLEYNRVTGEEHLLSDRGQRVRDVRQGPDGLLYVVTDEDSGEVWKIAPRR